MEVIKTKNVEDCFDGSVIKELQLSENMLKEQVYTLAKGGEIQYFAQFSRPFFKIRVSGVYDLKGIVGNNTVRIHIKNPAAFSINDFVALLTGI
ncbi:MAG: hypothetical protein JXA46_18540 [Dehalococcoidales bacterium]|nr:hypothetical protein [Dehalococcoidales bacterium]